MDFNDITWHDSIINNIVIDRSSPGNYDCINFDISYVDTGAGTLIFKNVFWANFDLNFGFNAKESILNATKAEDHPDLHAFYKNWNGFYDHIKLFHFTIELNSTGGKIKIIAGSFKKT